MSAYVLFRTFYEKLLTIIASLQGMVLRETFPVLLLFGRQESRTAAERTDILNCRHNCRTNELRPVGNVLDYGQQVLVGLKSYDVLLFLHNLTAIRDLL